jgi:hypothetical protein
MMNTLPNLASFGLLLFVFLIVFVILGLQFFPGTVYLDENCDADLSGTGDVTNEQDNCQTGLNVTYTDVEVPAPSVSSGTKEAEKDARRAIRKARRENPSAKIIVTGCSAQVNPDMYAQMPEVDQIIGNGLKMKAESWGLRHNDRVLVNDIMSVRETAGHLIEGFEGHTRAFLQVQNGCDHRCTFCIIPYGRGNSRSVPIGVIAEQVRNTV